MRKSRGADNRPDELACPIIDVDDELTRDEAVPEGDHARAVLETSVDDEPWNKACIGPQHHERPPTRRSGEPQSPFPCEWTPR